MPKADDLYLIYLKVQDLWDTKLQSWEKHFDWLDEVIKLNKHARGLPILPKTPAPRGRKRKIPEVVLEDAKNQPEHTSSQDSLIDSAKVTFNTNAETTEPTQVKDDGEKELMSVADLGDFEEDGKKKASKRKSRSTSRLGVDQKIKNKEYTNGLEDTCEERILKVKNNVGDFKVPKLLLPTIVAEEQRPIRSTRSKVNLVKVASELPMKIEMLPPPSVAQISDKSVDVLSESVEENHAKASYNKIRAIEELKDESSTTVARITRSKIKRNDENQNVILITNSPIINDKRKLLDDKVESIRITRSKIRTVPQLTDSPKRSPFRTKFSPSVSKGIHSPALTKNKLYQKEKPGGELSTSSVEVTLSPVKVVKHVMPITKLSTAKKLKTGVSYATPSPSTGLNRQKLLLGRTLSNTSKYSHQRTGTMPMYSPQHKMVRTPSDLHRPSNLVSNVGSFLTKVQVNKPSRDELEEWKQMELIRKREREEETRRKKEELMKAKMDERKRKNEERMRKVQDAREAKQKKADETRLMQERERKMKEDRIKELKIQEEKERKRRLLAAKKAEELSKRIKEEDEQRQKLEMIRREEEEAKLEALRREEESARLRKEEEIKVAELLKEEQRRKEEKLMFDKKRADERAALAEIQNQQRIVREKQEINKPQLDQSKKEELNSTYTKPPVNAAKEEVTSYEITPAIRPVIPLKNPNDYDINDINSDESTDDERDPRKPIPIWAKGRQLDQNIHNQYSRESSWDLDRVFPATDLLLIPNLSRMFTKQRTRFHARTSSAIWNTPPHKLFASN